MVAIRKLYFLVASCLASASTYVRDDRPTPSPPYYGLPTSPSHANSVVKSPPSSSSLASSSSVTAIKVSFGSHGSTYASTVHLSQDKSVSITATHITETIGGRKTSKNTPTGSISRKSTLSTTHGSPTLATQSPRSSRRVPSSEGSMQSKKTSVISQPRSKTASRPNVSKSSASSFRSTRSSVDHTKKPTTRASQSKGTSNSSRTRPTATLMKHSTKQTEAAASITRIRSTSVKAKLSTHMKTSQPSRTSIATKKPTKKQPTSSPSKSKSRASSSVPSRFSITKTSASSPLKITSTTTGSSRQQSILPNSQKLPTAGTNPKSRLSSVRRETSSVTTKNIGKTASGNSASFTLGRTIGKETTSSTRQFITRSAASQNSPSSATTKQPIGLNPTRSTALPAPTKKHTSTITATMGQSASIPRPTATMTTSRQIKTIVTGSKGIVATYIATQDPKYTTNRRTSTTTDDHGDNIVIFHGGWRWIPIGVPPLRLPSPPKFNPDPHPADDPGYDSYSKDQRTSHSKSSTSSARCTTTEPPECTKTVSFITSGTGFRR